MLLQLTKTKGFGYTESFCWFVKCRLVLLVFLNIFFQIQANNDLFKHSVQLQWCGGGGGNFDGDKQEENKEQEILYKNWTVPAAISAEFDEFTVSLVAASIQCGGGGQVIELKLNGSSSSSSLLQQQQQQQQPREKLFSNGYLYPNKSDVEYYHPREYCISEITENQVTFRYCHVQASPKINDDEDNNNYNSDSLVQVSQIPKCCPMSKLFTLGRVNGTSKSSCTPPKNGSSPFTPILYQSPQKKFKGQPVVHYKQKRMKTFNCSKDHPLLMMPHATVTAYAKDVHGLSGLCYRIRQDGTLLYLDSNWNWNEVTRDNYCFDGLQIEEAGQPFVGTEGDFGVFLCAIPQNSSQIRSVMYGCALIISSVFLLLTFIVYVLWNQQNIHGWTTISYTGSMFFMYLFLGTAYLLLYTMGHQVTRTLRCKILGILAHFFVLSTFCWLTVRSFDLFWTFRGMKARSQRSKGLQRFIIYAAFAWGLPLVFVAASVIVDSIYGSKPCNTIIVPSYGAVNCYLKEESFGLYLYYPIGILLSLNVLFVALTTYKLHAYKKGTRLATKSMNNERQQMFTVFIKLFFVMGVSWIFEFVSWWHAGHDLRWYWVILDFINVLQGAAIFVIFVCKTDIMRSLKTQYPSLHRKNNMSKIPVVCPQPF